MQFQPRSAEEEDATGVLTRRIRLFNRIVIVSWTLLICSSWYWNYSAERKVLHKVALAEANAVIERDAQYRRWGASHGGVYAPATRQTPPNPFLSHIPERDITAPSGRQLTLINPAYMTRQVNELSTDNNIFLGRAHITSLKPIRPENAPDLWESEALSSFEGGVKEAIATSKIDGKPFLRVMKPFIAEASCLKCHHGYSVGSVRGGISVLIPIQPLLDASRSQFVGSLSFHVMIWLLGLGMTWFGTRQLSREAEAQKRIENELYLQTLQLEEEIAEREATQNNLEELNLTLEERIGKAISELRHNDQYMIQQGRLAAMGEMINNIAHQWRQPLNNIGLIIQNLQISYESGTITREEMSEEISKSMDIIMHMSRTIDDFRNFFREDKQKSNFSISRTVRKALEFASTSLASYNIHVELDDDETVNASGYQNEYSQVLLNILSNTRETCIERAITSPRITIRIASENNRSAVYIGDNCGGIAADVMPRIFDPYFTTRSPDKGTGIGLYMSKVIIEQHMEGRLSAKNIDGGAEFRIEV